MPQQLPFQFGRTLKYSTRETNTVVACRSIPDLLYSKSPVLTYAVESRPCLAAATLSRLLFFTMYMASSARCSNSALVFESVG